MIQRVLKMSVSPESFRLQIEARDRLYYGTDVEIDLSLSREERYDGQTFPYYVARWRLGDTKYSVLLRPIVRMVERRDIWPLGKMKVYEVDNQAMREQLRRIVESTTTPA